MVGDPPDRSTGLVGGRLPPERIQNLERKNLDERSA